MATVQGLPIQFRGNISTNKGNIQPDRIIGFVLKPKGTFYTAAQLASLQTTMQNELINSDKTLRSYIVGNVGKFQDNSEKPKTNNLDGFIQTTFEGLPAFTYRLVAGAFSNYQDILQYKFSTSYDVFFIDDSDANVQAVKRRLSVYPNVKKKLQTVKSSIL